MVAYTRAKLLYLLKLDFIRFCIVGGTGFVINFALLTVLHHALGLTIFVAQLLAAEVALFSNFMLHHHWTYRQHKVDKSMPKLLLQFHATTWPAIFGSALMVTAGEKLFHLSNLAALALSSIIALFWNFLWSKYVIWRKITQVEIERIAQ